MKLEKCPSLSKANFFVLFKTGKYCPWEDRFPLKLMSGLLPQLTLILPKADLDPASLTDAPSREAGRWIDLVSGEAAPARLTGPTLVLDGGGDGVG